MNIQHKLLNDRIHLLTFDNQIELASTFLRFKEYYESPEFRGKFFSLDEYKKWYISNSEVGQKTGEFTYYDDWTGFNIPSYVFAPFKEGKFNPLSEQEIQLLDIFKDSQEPFYVIGILGNTNSKEILKHEIAHGLFYTDKFYHDKIMDVLSRFDLTKMKEKLHSMNGYHADVFDDECHAYSVSTDSAKEYVSKEMIELVKGIYTEHTKKIN